MKLQQIAEDVAYKLGDQFNHTLKESIKDTLIIYRSKFIRDDVDRNGVISYNHFIQYFKTPMEEVNLLEVLGGEGNYILNAFSGEGNLDEYTVSISTQRIPKPVRLKNFSKDLYSYVGTISGMKRFVFVTIDTFPYVSSVKQNKKNIYYTIWDDRILILNNLLCDDNLSTLDIKELLIQGIFDNPRDVWTFCNSDRFIDDNEFPISNDMLLNMKQGIITGEYRLAPKEGQDVHLKPDINDNN